MKRRPNGQGSVCHRSDGRWYARIVVEGRLRHKYARTRRECLTWLRERRREISWGLPSDPLKRRPNHHGSLTRRQDGRWYARITVWGRQRHHYSRSPAECETWLQEQRREAGWELPLPGAPIEHWFAYHEAHGGVGYGTLKELAHMFHTTHRAVITSHWRWKQKKGM